MMNSKKGMTTLQYFVIAELILAVFVFIALMSYVSGVASNSLFEQNFFTRDVGLLLDAVYSAPGDVSVAYDAQVQENKVLFVKFFPETKLRFAFGEARVLVFRDSYGELYQTPATYYFGTNSKMQFIPPSEASVSSLGQNQNTYSIPNVKSNLLLKKADDKVSVEFTEMIPPESSSQPSAEVKT